VPQQARSVARVVGCVRSLAPSCSSPLPAGSRSARDRALGQLSQATPSPSRSSRSGSRGRRRRAVPPRPSGRLNSCRSRRLTSVGLRSRGRLEGRFRFEFGSGRWWRWRWRRGRCKGGTPEPETSRAGLRLGGCDRCVVQRSAVVGVGARMSALPRVRQPSDSACGTNQQIDLARARTALTRARQLADGRTATVDQRPGVRQQRTMPSLCTRQSLAEQSGRSSVEPEAVDR